MGSTLIIRRSTSPSDFAEKKGGVLIIFVVILAGIYFMFATASLIDVLGEPCLSARFGFSYMTCLVSSILMFVMCQQTIPIMIVYLAVITVRCHYLRSR